MNPAAIWVLRLQPPSRRLTMRVHHHHNKQVHPRLRGQPNPGRYSLYHVTPRARRIQDAAVSLAPFTPLAHFMPCDTIS